MDFITKSWEVWLLEKNNLNLLMQVVLRKWLLRGALYIA